MIRQRTRIRFRKEGDLRLISHRDLVRAFERLFRRAALPLGMSQGFHPKARMSFPLALGLGIEGRDEVMEVELAQPVSDRELLARLQPLVPCGLTITSIQVLEPGQGKARVQRVTYRLALPGDRLQQAQAALTRLLAQKACPVHRPGSGQVVDLLEGLDHLQLVQGALSICLRTSRTASVRPQDILEALGLDDLHTQGYFLTRTAVELQA